MKIKNVLSKFVCILSSVAVCTVATACDKSSIPPETTPDGFDITEATPVNTYTYDIPQDYSRTYYEVFIRSFADGSGDGIGDIRGLINNLDYLNDGDDSTTSDLGINGIWMMPIHQSPSYHKYDVIDYYSIDSEYGTMSDFEDLVEACDERDIWLQMDLVLNHTSTEHAWFKRAVSDAKLGFEPEESEAMMKYSFVHSDDKPSSGKWHQVSGTDLWYLGNFDQGMPDVNLSNTAVRDEIKNIVDFWLEKGVKSFRLDAVPWACENSVSWSNENGAFWTWFNDYCNEKGQEVYGDKYPNLDRYCYNVGEVLETSGAISNRFFSTGMSNFNFKFSGIDNSTSFATVATGKAAAAYAYDMAEMQTYVYDYYGEGTAILSNLLSNHDTNRLANAMGIMFDETIIKKAAGLYLLAPGNPYIYYGEEIGAVGSGRDENKRLPFNWGDTSKGLTTAPINADYTGEQKLGTWAGQTADKDSVLTYYRQAIRLRNRFPEIGRGIMTAYAVNMDGKVVPTDTLGISTGFPNVNDLNRTIVAYTFEYKGGKTLIVHNVGNRDANIDISAFDGYDVVGAVKANGGRVVQKNGRLYISGGISAVLKSH